MSEEFESCEENFEPEDTIDDQSIEPSGGVLRLWFGLSRPVSQQAYILTGFGLMALKYLVEAAVIGYYSGRFFSPLDFVNPMLSLRQQFFMPPVPEWVPWGIFIWSLPFLWIAVGMTVRRTVDAGFSPWQGLLVLIPFANLIWMLTLCLAPRSTERGWVTRKVKPQSQHQITSALWGVGSSLGIALVMVGFSVYALKDYGATLFLGTPIWMGAVSAFIYNRPFSRSLLGSLLVAEASILIAGAALLLFAFEGIICLAMLFPAAGVMGLLGGLIGHFLGAVAEVHRRHMTIAAFFLPLFAGAETVYRPIPVYEVVSSVEIEASPEQVWPFVIGFSELPDPAPWYFRLGVAYPKRATITGRGVGAVRRCEFSTGAFVEPITVWEPPARLAFNVIEQPPPMHELSPYRHVHPPHLDGYLRCRRGEFRLVRLDGNRTRLEGSTWYEFEMYPQDYWTLWSDGAIHRIHLRVLEHIKRLSEQSMTASGSSQS